MKEISFREFIRNWKKYMPIPTEGIRIVRRGEDDFVVLPVAAMDWTAGEALPETVEEIVDRVIPKCELDVITFGKYSCQTIASQRFLIPTHWQQIEGRKAVMLCEKHFEEVEKK